LFSTRKKTGRLHSAARFIVSPKLPVLEAPSPNMQTVTASSLLYSEERARPAAIGRLPPTIP
jgi:hypothetical protein